MNGVLAGFDYVAEISNAALLRQLLRTVTIRDAVSGTDVSIQPPFSLSLPAAAGTANLIVDDVLLEINGLDSVTVSFAFSRSSLVPAGGLAPLFPLGGTIAVNLLLRLEAPDPVGAPAQRAIVADFATALVSLGLSAEGQQTVARAAAQVGGDAAAFTGLIEGGIRSFIQALPAIVLPQSYAVTPGQDGSLQPLRFSRLRLWCIGAPDKGRQSLALFGNLFASTEAQGRPEARTESGIAAGQDAMVAFSNRVFHDLVFCPAVERGLSAQLRRPLRREELPATCGAAGSIDVADVTITEINGFLHQGELQINTRFQKSGACYDAKGTVISYVKPSVVGGALTTAVRSVPQVTVKVPWYCELATLGAAGAVGWLMLDYLREVAEDTATRLAQSFGGGLLGGLAVDLGGAPGLIPTSVVVTPQALAVHGRLLRGPVTPSYAELALAGRVELVKGESRNRFWTTRIFCQREVKRYEYIATRQSQRARYDLRSRLLALPLSVVYSVRGRSGDWQVLVPRPALGIPTPPLVVGDVECRYPQPLASGGSVVVKSVSLRYRVDGTEVSLFNDPADGNFWVDLRAQVLDASGQPPAGVDANPIATVFFHGDVVEMGEDYQDDLEECMRIVEDVNDRYKQARRVPPWEQAFDPVSRVRHEVRALAAIGDVRGEDLLRHFHNLRNAPLARLTATTAQPALAEEGASAARLREGAVLESRIEAAIEALSATLAELRRRR